MFLPFIIERLWSQAHNVETILLRDTYPATVAWPLHRGGAAYA